MLHTMQLLTSRRIVSVDRELIAQDSLQESRIGLARWPLGGVGAMFQMYCP
jgi:hypothetical protein